MVQYRQVRKDDGTINPNLILRIDDNSWIPTDSFNIDYQNYLLWVGAGNTPLPPTAIVADTPLELRAIALSIIESPEGDAKALRSVVLGLLDEINTLRTRFNDLQADVQASNNVNQIKAAWALRPTLPDRTGVELKAVMIAKVVSGDAD